MDIGRVAGRVLRVSEQLLPRELGEYMGTLRKVSDIVTRSLVLVMLSMAAVGCARYYKVTDVSTGRAYYTKNVDHKAGGAVRFEDDSTETIVTLQSSDVERVSHSQYKAGVRAVRE